jgi:hypothetical protein
MQFRSRRGPIAMKETKRRDHYIPQGYLRGFIDPSRKDYPRPLWYFDVARNRWFAKSPKEIGHRKGFYDYVNAGKVLEHETADSAFLRLENDYPRVREELISSRYERWSDHLEFLLAFMQMMRARSILFREQKMMEGKSVLAYEIEEVYQDRNAVKLKSMTPQPVSSAFIRNRAITQMRDQIEKGAAWLKEFHWALRYCETVDNPFVISELPFAIEGKTADLQEALRHPNTLILFPLCWQACLFGSLQRFDTTTDKFNMEDMRSSRRSTEPLRRHLCCHLCNSTGLKRFLTQRYAELLTLTVLPLAAIWLIRMRVAQRLIAK